MCILPGVFVRPVVAREPLLGANQRGIHIVTHEVGGMFWGLPLHKSRCFGVSGSNHLSWGRGDTCTKQKHNFNKHSEIFSQVWEWKSAVLKVNML